MVRKYHLWVGLIHRPDIPYFEERDTGSDVLPSQLLREIGIKWRAPQPPPHKGMRMWSPRVLPRHILIREFITEFFPRPGRPHCGKRFSSGARWGHARRTISLERCPKRIDTLISIAHSRVVPHRARQGLKYLGAILYQDGPDDAL